MEQPGVLATLSRWRPWVQIPPGTLDNMARYANRQSGQAQTLVIVGSTPTCATYWVVLLAAACKAVVAKQARWATRGSIPSQPTETNMARSSNGRMSGPQPGDAGSTPVRATFRPCGDQRGVARPSRCRKRGDGSGGIKKAKWWNW